MQNMTGSSLKTIVLCFFFTGCFVTDCTKQHDPSAHLDKMKKEQTLANRDMPKLNSDGSITGADAKVVDPMVAIKTKYQTLCSSCHGTEGKGDGVAAAALNPKPRDFSDKAWQKSSSDERIHKAIAEGGAAVGVSPTMAPWKSMFSADELNLLVKLIRTMAN